MSFQADVNKTIGSIAGVKAASKLGASDKPSKIESVANQISLKNNETMTNVQNKYKQRFASFEIAKQEQANSIALETKQARLTQFNNIKAYRRAVKERLMKKGIINNGQQ